MSLKINIRELGNVQTVKTYDWIYQNTDSHYFLTTARYFDSQKEAKEDAKKVMEELNITDYYFI